MHRRYLNRLVAYTRELNISAQTKAREENFDNILSCKFIRQDIECLQYIENNFLDKLFKWVYYHNINDFKYTNNNNWSIGYQKKYLIIFSLILFNGTCPGPSIIVCTSYFQAVLVKSPKIVNSENWAWSFAS